MYGIVFRGPSHGVRYRNGVNAKQWILEKNIKPCGKNTQIRSYHPGSPIQGIHIPATIWRVLACFPPVKKIANTGATKTYPRLVYGEF